MIKTSKCFDKKGLLTFGIVLVTSFTALFAMSLQSQYAEAQNQQPMMSANEMMSMNQTSGQNMDMDMAEMMNMMNMMNMMMNMMNMMMNMMNMSSDMSNDTDMHMSIPMNHSQSGSNMSMMNPEQLQK